LNSLSTAYLSKLKFNETALSFLTTIGQYKGKQELFFRQTPEILNTLKSVAIIESSESSNRLEGITAPYKRIEKIVIKNTEPKNRSEQEIAGYRDGLNLIHESAQHMEVSNNVILQLHKLLYRYMKEDGGHWKRGDNEIVERSSDGTILKVRFKPVSALLTPNAMEDLVKNYQIALTQDHREPLIVIPLMILDFLCVHPFSDGNGRISRLLTLMLLYQFGYEVGRFISLERIFEESKETYYETLEKCSIGWHEGEHDVYPWLNYFWGVMLRAYKEFEERVGEIRNSKGSKSQQIKQSILRKVGPFAISDIENDCVGISRDMIRLVLRKLRDEKIIENISSGQKAKWILKK
jgi:Fic family protein